MKREMEELWASLAAQKKESKDLRAGMAAQKEEMEARFATQKKEMEEECQRQADEMYFFGYRCCIRNTELCMIFLLSLLMRRMRHLGVRPTKTFFCANFITFLFILLHMGQLFL